MTTFVVNCAPFLAIQLMQQLAEDVQVSCQEPASHLAAHVRWLHILVPTEMSQRWHLFLDEYSDLNQIRVPRWVWYQP